ncbi:MAG: nuclear transport factor 2 family protein [Novosphingobium sp.]
MPFSGPMEDRMAIRELYDTYGDASCRGDVETFLSCWAQDGQWNTHLFQCTGTAELREQWNALWTGFDKVAFIGNVLSIEVDGDTASTRSLAREVIALKGGGVFKLAGLYRDSLVRQDGAWRFLKRDYEVLVEEAPA